MTHPYILFERRKQFAIWSKIKLKRLRELKLKKRIEKEREENQK